MIQVVVTLFWGAIYGLPRSAMPLAGNTFLMCDFVVPRCCDADCVHIFLARCSGDPHPDAVGCEPHEIRAGWATEIAKKVAASPRPPSAQAAQNRIFCTFQTAMRSIEVGSSMRKSTSSVRFLALAICTLLLAIGLMQCTKTDRGTACIPAQNEDECRVCCDDMGLSFKEWFQREIDRGDCFCE